MRPSAFLASVGSAALWLCLAGCSTGLISGDDPLGDIAGWTEPDNYPPLAGAADADAVEPVSSHQISGMVGGAGNYRLFDLGPSSGGQVWNISLDQSSSPSPLIVVLFDENDDLLMRGRVSSRNPLNHVLRLGTGSLRLGIASAYGTQRVDFRFQAERLPDEVIPSPRQQIVYVDFGPGVGVQVQNRSPLSFPALDGAILGQSYAGHTTDIKAAILATMQEDYAPYDVVLISSDEVPPPAGVAYSSIHFGGEDSALLGLADSVDMYNREQSQTAIIYLNAFAAYHTMKLTSDEMGVMIGNVASHELGHLLGLYHTKDPSEVMDSTGSAWDLAGDQMFHRGALEDTVFPTGYENTPRLLEQSVGLRKTPQSAKRLDAAKARRYKELRSFMKEELRCRCGLCLDPDL